MQQPSQILGLVLLQAFRAFDAQPSTEAQETDTQTMRDWSQAAIDLVSTLENAAGNQARQVQEHLGTWHGRNQKTDRHLPAGPDMPTIDRHSDPLDRLAAQAERYSTGKDTLLGDDL